VQHSDLGITGSARTIFQGVPVETGTPTPRPSKIGIASLIAWLLSLIAICVLFFTNFLPYITNSDSSLPVGLQSALYSVMAGVSCLLPLLALILGLIGLFQKGTYKTFAIIGTIGAGMTILCGLLPLAAWAILIMMV
jgi:hypothetical protein